MKVAWPLWLWAARDLIRHPFEAILMALALISLIVVAGVPLLLSQAISVTAYRLLDNGPSMVVRRVVAGNWNPIPSEEAVHSAKSVTGVLSAEPRIWGVVTGPEKALTIMGIQKSDVKHPEIFLRSIEKPGPGEAVIGSGVLDLPLSGEMGNELILINGRRKVYVKVKSMLSGRESMLVHDMVLLHEKDARHLLELEEGFASDLAINVFHDQEINAVIPDLVKAFPWPVAITTKQETLKMYTASGDRRAGLIYVALVPSLLAMALVVSVGYRGTRSKCYEAGLLKALGWTTQDIVSFFMFKSALIAFPALAMGMAAAYVLVYWPGISWPGYLFFGWQNNPPGLYLDSTGSIRILIQLAGGVLVPYLISNLWPAIENAMADPHELLQSEGTL